MVEAAHHFGRGSAAGSLIYNLYHKPTKESTFDEELACRLAKMREERELLEHPKEKPIPKSRAKVRVPRMTGRRPVDPDSVPSFRYYRPIRRSEAAIKAEMQAQAGLKLPPIDKKYIPPEEKDRLARYMEYDGDVPVVVAPPPRPAPPPPRKPLDVQELFDEVVEEIREREEFLAEMRALGRAADVEVKVKQEISQRVAELKRLDRFLKANAAAQEDL
eukprot:EG_transcript_18099